MSHILFRGGSNLFFATKGFSSVDVRFVMRKNEWHPMLVANATIDPRLIITELESAPLKVSTKGECFERLIRADVLLATSIGMCENLQGFDVDRGYKVLVEDETRWFDSSNILAHPQFSQTLAIEGLGTTLFSMGLCPDAEKVLGSSVSLIRSVRAYMRKDPFIGITKLSEGTTVSVEEYVNGCVRVDADGESFWVPVEESFFRLPKYKDDEFYFTMDADHDLVPDMINYAPAHPALGPEIAGYETNFNTQPDLTDVAGLFSPGLEIANDDTLDNVSAYPPTTDVTGDMVNRILAGDSIDRMFAVDAETKPYRDEFKK